MRRLPPVILLALVYCLAVGSVRPLDLAMGVLVGYLVLRALRLALEPVPLGEFVRRAAAFPAFAWAVLLEVATGTVQVTLIVLGLRPPASAGIVAVPLDERTRTGVAVSAFALTLSPGEVLVEIDWESRQMLVHAVDARDPQALRARHRRLYERYQRPVFP
jgi:multisubunit Na+/H+ antiporter MnhE subunit